jgi:hypothetical protein
MKLLTKPPLPLPLHPPCSYQHTYYVDNAGFHQLLQQATYVPVLRRWEGFEMMGARHDGLGLSRRSCCRRCWRCLRCLSRACCWCLLALLAPLGLHAGGPALRTSCTRPSQQHPGATN